MAIKGIDHIVIRVKDLDAAIESYSNLGMALTRRLETPAIGKQAIFRFGDDSFLELVAPLTPDSAVGRAIEKHGEGIHTIALAVDNIDETVDDLTQRGAPVIRAEGLDTIAFVHPRSTHGVLLQVQQK